MSKTRYYKCDVIMYLRLSTSCDSFHFLPISLFANTSKQYVQARDKKKIGNDIEMDKNALAQC